MKHKYNPFQIVPNTSQQNPAPKPEKKDQEESSPKARKVTKKQKFRYGLKID